jgi:hypothetical protein
LSNSTIFCDCDNLDTYYSFLLPLRLRLIMKANAALKGAS